MAIRTLGEIIRSALANHDAPIQVLHECLLGARSVGSGKNRKRGQQSYTRVEFGTTNMTPNDAMWFTGELGQPKERKPKYIGVIVWVPTDEYEKPDEAASAVPEAPHE